MLKFEQAIYYSPIGEIKVEGCQRGISKVLFLYEEEKGSSQDIPEPLKLCFELLDDYFAKKIGSFHPLPLAIAGTDFELDVWDSLNQIPYGETFTYRQVAEMTGQKKAVRAVGNALHKNPLQIILPCHRVVPTVGGTGHYAAGSEKKKWLLEHESKEV